jgi:hypothetical protein
MSEPRIIGTFWCGSPSDSRDSDDPCNYFRDLLVAGDLSSYSKSGFPSVDGGFIFRCLQCDSCWYICDMAEQQDS